jgi:hypothetical protein
MRITKTIVKIVLGVAGIAFASMQLGEFYREWTSPVVYETSFQASIYFSRLSCVIIGLVVGLVCFRRAECDMAC